MERVQISEYKWNYLKDDGTYLFDKHVYWCDDFSEGFGLIEYRYESYNFVNLEGKKLLKTNVKWCYSFNENGIANVEINNIRYYMDKECNFYPYLNNNSSLKELYKR